MKGTFQINMCRIKFKKKGRSLFALTYPLLFMFFLCSLAYPGGPVNNEKRHRKILKMYSQYKDRAFPSVYDISPEQVFKIMKRLEVVFLDIRGPEEQSVSMIKGAITEAQFFDELDSYKNRTVIAYCTISYRSGILTEKLGKKGIHIINLRGGLLAWVHAGGRLHKNGKEVKKLHVYGRKWDLAPAGYESLMF